MGEYTIDCENVNTMPDDNFRIDRKNYSVPGKDVVLNSSSIRLFAFMGINILAPGPQWILNNTTLYFTRGTKVSALIRFPEWGSLVTGGVMLYVK